MKCHPADPSKNMIGRTAIEHNTLTATASPDA
jgi:hypothetical protein